MAPVYKFAAYGEEGRQVEIGWIGTGNMGAPLCGHLIQAGHRVHIHNRDRKKARDLLAAGGLWYPSPVALADKCQVIFTMVGLPIEAESVIAGPKGVLAQASPGSIIVDMTTSDPEMAMLLYDHGRDKLVSVVDAPVTGGQAGARNGTLTVMAGGDPHAFDKVRPLLDVFAQKVFYMGAPGTGQHTKICNQILVAANMVGAAESLTYADRAGINFDALIDAVGSGTAASWVLNTLGRKIARDDFEPGFYIRLFIKDLGIAIKSAERLRLSLPGLALARQLYLAASAMGYDQLSTHGLFKVIQRLNTADPDAK